MENISVNTLYEKGELTIPDAEVDRILEDYGDYTFTDFDNKFKFNDILGKMYVNSYQTMTYILTKPKKEIVKHFDKLTYPLTDIFNIEASVIGTIIGPIEWLA